MVWHKTFHQGTEWIFPYRFPTKYYSQFFSFFLFWCPCTRLASRRYNHRSCWYRYISKINVYSNCRFQMKKKRAFRIYRLRRWRHRITSPQTRQPNSLGSRPTKSSLRDPEYLRIRTFVMVCCCQQKLREILSYSWTRSLFQLLWGHFKYSAPKIVPLTAPY